MFKKQHLALAIAATLAAGAAQAALETSVTLKNETAYMMKDGIRTGEATSTTDTTGEGKGVYKFENTAKIYLNDELESGGSWHGELNIVRDSKAINNYQGHETNTQRDWLRELYVDKTVGDWDLRLGKQQVVWGTADGIKLLDMINPTDWSEFNQNTPADARIPVWMVNAEKYLDNGGNIQVIMSQAEVNKIAGLNASGDQGHPFVMKGVDSITGKVNGFLNVAPNLANVATTFNGAAAGAGGVGGFQQLATNLVDYSRFAGWNGSSSSLAPFTSMTVDGFASGTWYKNGTTNQILSFGQTGSGTAPTANTSGDTGADNGVAGAAYSTGAHTQYSGIQLLYGMAENGLQTGDSNANNGETNLVNTTWDISAPDSAFEFMPNATFATFNTMSGMTTRYVKDKTPRSPNLGFRFKNSTDKGLNFSVNYAYRYDGNPYIDLGYYDASSGNKLTTQYVQGPGTGVPVTDGSADVTAANIGTSVTARSDADTKTLVAAAGDSYTDANADGYADTGEMYWYYIGGATDATTVMLKDDSGNYYGKYAWSGSGAANTAAYTDVELRFTEKMNRVHSIGTSLDYALDFNETPIVLRGEFLYNKDEMTPVVNKKILGIGDLAGALSMQKADMFKYVLGADVTVLTDMMLSGQFIQFRNLDFVDQSATCTTQMGNSFNCSTYTADMATLHMSNGLQKAEKNKEFYSLFLSKPFGESGEGRWNNIFMYEEGGGKWNRFDVEYGFDDQLIGTFEVNKYFGDNNTMFGQFENASNVQIGVKYLLQ